MRIVEAGIVGLFEGIEASAVCLSLSLSEGVGVVISIGERIGDLMIGDLIPPWQDCDMLMRW